MPSSRGSSQPRSPTLQAGSLPSEPPGKPKNTGGDSLSLLQGNFLTQGLNQGLLHCRGILYQLSYQGSPGKPILPCKYLDSFTCLKYSSDELGGEVSECDFKNMSNNEMCVNIWKSAKLSILVSFVE
ncbi:unnamed protein product [Rangifer tarandus platyrhynchus]|uniref:Uncharacterized protein n=2 Tax=Rangifer tarandus platyrhynchus TaxID=3082113 RepID=A0AC59ZXK4_RANTA|nr:unnamed protein product [Rangifer tarandus platyrhynchus]